MKRTIIVSLLVCVFTATATAQVAKYGIKSGIITSSTSILGKKIESTLYFDHYGANESIITEASTGQMAQSSLKMMIKNIGDTVYSASLSQKTGIKMPMPQKGINYLRLTPEDMKKYNMKDKGEEEVCGKKCQKYTMAIIQNNQTVKSTVWIWKGIPLKTITSIGLLHQTQVVTDIKENIDVKNEYLEFPEGITFSLPQQ